MEAILQNLQKLTKFHQDLLKVSEQKTDAVKDGDTDQLQSLLIQERKYTQVLERTEEKRTELVQNWFKQKGIAPEEPTITNMLKALTDDEDKQLLEKQTVELTEAIVKLKQQEELNMALIQQSMQFVQMSLDLMNPTLNTMNYGNKKEQPNRNRGVFDSKA
ncbi:flagellar protein FlgN [Ornithinibacillus halophilus]|nr:flagellar protein FlgN [Ornithinibacillus halophilus]